MKKRQRFNKKHLIISIIILLLVGIGAFFGAKALYDKGIRDGETIMSDQITGQVTDLAKVVSEKVAISQKITDTLSKIPTEANSETIAEYIEALNALKASIENEAIANLLDSYRSEWEKFEQVYATEDNSAIAESFERLKTFSAETATKIKESLDQNIKSALDSLE